MIVERFEKSQTTYGIKYTILSSSGDWSVMKNLVEKVSYGSERD